MRLDWKYTLWISIFALCIAPTFVSYARYSFTWDDSDYLWRSIAASRAFWSGNTHELGVAMVSIRPPVMTLLGLPWGPLTSWDDVGKCFLTLAAFVGLAASCCLFLLLRAGLKPLYLAIASLCVFVALGPYPENSAAHGAASGFMADSLFAWIALAAILLIPYEVIDQTTSTRASLARGLLWAVIFLAGAFTKVSFGYFIVTIVPVLFAIRMRLRGRQNATLSLISLVICSLPIAIYYLRYGHLMLRNGWAASFGHDATFFYVPPWQFLGYMIRESPGLLLSGVFAIASIVYWAVKRCDFTWDMNLVPLLIAIGYCGIAFSSGNRELRYLFLGYIAPPFLIGMLISGKSRPFPRGPATVAAMLVFCFVILAGVPVLHRANRQCIARSEAILAQAAESKRKHVLLATNSPSLNVNLMKVANELSPPGTQVEIDWMGWNSVIGTSIQDDFRQIRESDLVVFQDNVGNDFSNRRVSDYEPYVRQNFGDLPIKKVDDTKIYCTDCTTLSRPEPAMQ
jgi:hypothetical protein